MKRFFVVALFIFLLSPLSAFAGLDDFLTRVNVEARADLPGFSARISSQFGVPEARVSAVLQAVAQPADAFMVFQLGEFSGRPAVEVLEVYQGNRKRGWGVIAKELGIKPGSREFHALKSGNLHFAGASGGSGASHGPAGGRDGGHGKGKGHGKHK